MNFRQFEILISAPRLARYKASCTNNTRKTAKLYRANIRISQCFLATLSLFEVVLRNKIDAHYKSHFPASAGGDEWLLVSISNGGFLTHRNCHNTWQKIDKAYRDLGINFTHDKLLAELSFGTWKYMFAGHQFQAGGSTLLNIFPNLPAGYSQRNVYTKLNGINSIRNRVAHHEPICFGTGNTIGTLYLRNRYQDVADVLSWMGISHHELFFGIDGILKEADKIDGI